MEPVELTTDDLVVRACPDPGRPKRRARPGAGMAGQPAAITRWGSAEPGLRRVQWRAEVGNEASRRVAEKAGYRMKGVLRQTSALSRDGVAG